MRRAGDARTCSASDSWSNSSSRAPAAVEERWREFSEELQRTPLPETSQAINERVEEAFTPVYDRIPALRDWHYSLRGQTTELVLRAFGRLEEEIELRLLGGLEERIGDASEGAGRVMQEEMLAEVERWFGRELASVPPGLGTRYERMLEPILKNTERRFAVSVGPTALRAAMTGMGTSVGVTVLANRFAGMLASGSCQCSNPSIRPRLKPLGGDRRGRRRRAGYQCFVEGVRRVAQPGRARTGIDRAGGQGEREGKVGDFESRKRRQVRGAG